MTAKQRKRPRSKGIYTKLTIGPLPGTIDVFAKTRKFFPKEGTKPERIKMFVAYCKKHQGYPIEKKLLDGEVYYEMRIYDTDRVRNGLGRQCKIYGMKMPKMYP